MPVRSPEQCAALALKMKAKFVKQFFPREFIVTGDIHPGTGAEVGGKSEVIDCYREEYDDKQIDGQQIQARDFSLLVINSDIKTINMRTDNLKVIVDGARCEVVRAVDKDAGAAWTLQVRG